ncbi:thioredoxin reductase [Candidatus Shapirobacteria bacterium CG08_land_8_20_14_0_20_39_18]|uniref:Thioredoxin reductase n=1 Tax=Candidatus Shapirobacteria bacterium CG08_land_8_20_14_0_20_39_18 TaxID=1974883 RepID=A0A2M6XCE4_9BACT|nr:MAG: thioredoxin reductase [Candidatus Shapirobacteria bacterium CG08_land_8_20_14_0_20_39_18]PIY65552.1 MAG: thioredoxin reductase [Candidatus Shapirobacteria bacterium CG_4_10_14_0_8_um_filter_39_15]
MYDLIIIGLGPAGLTAGIYASRYRLKNLIIGKELGGTITLAHAVENYPGFESVSGVEWSQKTLEQTKKLGSEIVYGLVEKIERLDVGYKVILRDGQKQEARSVIIATGSERRKLNVPGETEYLGRGISYCTTCDIPFYKEKTVAMIGGGDAAVSGAIHGAEFADKVYIIYRKDKLRAEPIWTEEALQNKKIEVIYNTNVIKILGTEEIKDTDEKSKIDQNQDKVGGVELDKPYNGSNILPVDGVFIEIGAVPGTSLAQNLGVALDEVNYILVGEDMSTNLPGVFGAGDLTDNSKNFAQMIGACAQGAIAAASAYKYLKGEKAPRILGA